MEEAKVSSVAIGVAVGCTFLALLIVIGIVQFCCNRSCKKCRKRCKRNEASLKEKVLTKFGQKKSPPPFSISGCLK